ncbi:MAG: hypothetical protein AAGC60_24260 [Acidobacteriota bacterium]
MFFESRTDAPPVSDAYAEAAELFAAGRARAARSVAAEAGPWRLEGDALLCSDLERAGAFYRRYFAVVQLAGRRFAGGSGGAARRLAIERTRVDMVRGRWQRATARVDELLRDADDDRALLEALLASAWAQIGFAARAARHRERALAEGADDARVDYELAYAEVCLRRWDEAAMYGARAVERAPRWPRARVFFAESLLARGQVAEAVQVVYQPLEEGLQDATLELLAGLQAFHLGDHERALGLLVRYETGWGRERKDESLRPILPLLPWRFDDTERVLEELETARPELVASLRERGGGRRRLISLPAVRQEHQLCLPTAVTMAVAPQQVTLDPRELFAAAGGTEGLPIWRMVETLRGRYYEVRVVRARLDIVRALLDQGVALIGQIEGLFENHVEVICGEDEGLGMLYLRDPEAWTPGLMPADALDRRYALSGGGLLVVLSGAWARRVVFPPDARALEAEALIVLERACARGEIEVAERAAAAIDDASPAAVRRDLVGRGIVATPAAVSRRLLAVAADGERHPLSRLRAILTLERTDLLDEVLDAQEEDFLGHGGQRLVQLARLRADGRWDAVEVLCGELLDRFPQLDTLWIHRAEAAARCGRLDEARRHADHALELSPESVHVRSLVRQLFPSTRPAADEAEELRQLLRKFPEHHALRRELAQTLSALGDGLALEEALREVQKATPRMPVAWGQLAAWYLVQDRDDLAHATLEEGRRWVGVDELPLWPFELDDDEPAVAESIAEDPDAHAEAVAPPLGFTEEERELLWQQARREIADGGGVALDRLCELERAGRLPWYEAANLLALRLHARVLDEVSGPIAGEPTAAEDAVSALLPETLDGPPLAALAAVLGALEPRRLPRRVAVVVLRWAESLVARESMPKLLLPELELGLAALHESCGDAMAAERRYRRLTEEHERLAYAWHRLGVVLAARGALDAAATAQRRALALEPGQAEALESLLEIVRGQGNRVDELVLLAGRCRLWPYSTDALHELVHATAATRGRAAALAELEARGGTQRSESLTVLRALILLSDDPEAAAAALDLPATRDSLDEVEPRRTLDVRVALLRARGELSAALAELDAALARTPDDPWMVRLRAELLEERGDHEELGAFCRRALLDGAGDAYLALRWLAQCDDPPQDAGELLAAADDATRPALAMALAAALEDTAPLEVRIAFLERCRNLLPALVPLRDHLARLYHAAGETLRAIAEAEDLLTLDPEAPERMALLGSVLLESKPKQALQVLGREVERSGSIESRLQIAFAHHRLGRGDAAEAAYREVAEATRPEASSHAVALLNLALLGRVDDWTWSALLALLEQPDSARIDGLHLQLVELARARGERLPEAWLRGAAGRFEQLMEAEPTDERLRLGVALARWLAERGDAEAARRTRAQAGGFVRRLNLLWWPGARWIPPREPTEGRSP